MALESEEADLTGIKRWEVHLLNRSSRGSSVLESDLRSHLTSKPWENTKATFSMLVLKSFVVQRLTDLEIRQTKLFQQFYLECFLVQVESQGESQSLFD